MNKFILLFLMLMPFASAINEDGKITQGRDLWIIDVDVKVDDRSSRNLDFDEEISKKANPNSVIKLDIGLRNNNSGLTMQDAFVEVVLADLDLEDISDEKDISPSSEEKFSLEFILPSDVEDTTYDILITSEGELNNSIHKVEYELDLVVEVPETETSSPTSLVSRIDSLNSTVNELNKNIDSYFEPYALCVSERDSLKEQLKTKDTSIISLQGYESKFTTCNDNLLVCNTERAEKSMANESCYRSIVEVFIPKVKSQQNWTMLGVIATALNAIAYNQHQHRKEKEGSESEKPEPISNEAT